MHGEVKASGDSLSNQERALEKDILKPAFAKLILAAPPSGVKNETLAKEMAGGSEEVGDSNAPNNKKLPCAYTYFGQLVAHDLTAHRRLGTGVPPSLRLNTLYGFGGGAAPHVYEHEFHPQTGYAFRGVKFFLDSYKLHGDPSVTVYDLPRRSLDHSFKAATRQSAPPNMADARNDQNFILSQLSVALMRRHNQHVVATYTPSTQGAPNFEKARLRLAHEYQDVILTDYLPRILWGDPTELLTDLASSYDKYLVFEPQKDHPCRLSELFARAGMRFHTQVRPIYQVRELQGPVHLFGGNNDLKGFVRDTRRKIDWQCLLYEGQNQRGEDSVFQPAKAFDHRIVLTLGDLPFLVKTRNDLIKTNLDQSSANFDDGVKFFKTYIDSINSTSTQLEIALKGKFKGDLRLLELEENGLVPPGTNEALKDLSKDEKEAELKSRLLTSDALLANIIAKAEQSLGHPAGQPIPLWLFLLLEADVFSDGERLGPLGSRIVAEQMLWTLQADKESVLYWRFGEKDLSGSPAYTTLKDRKNLYGGERLTLAKWLAKVDPAATAVPADLAPFIAQTRQAPAQPLEPGNGSKSLYPGTETGAFWATLESAKQVVEFLNNADEMQADRRNVILQNGYYDYPPNAPLVDPKARIRVYVSRQRIFQHCGINPAPAVGDDDIRGLFFYFAMNDAAANPRTLFLTVRPTLSDGSAPEGNGQWLRTDSGDLIDSQRLEITDPDGTVTPIQGKTSKELEKERQTCEDNFVANKFAHLCEKGFSGAALIVDARQLLRLLKYDGPLPVNAVELKFYLVAATGKQLASFDDIATDRVDEPYQDLPFFALAIESPPDAVTEANKDRVVSAAGRPYPPYCYSNSFADWK